MNKLTLIQEAQKALIPTFAEIDQKVKTNLKKVLQAFKDNKVGTHHFSSVSGYGHDDLGRDTLDQVFAQVNDFNAWEAWSPWAKLDPDATVNIEGAGVGQTMTWKSENPEVGNGSQTITTLEAPQKMVTHLDFGDMGVSDASFTLEPTDGQTKVTWSLDADMREGVPLLKQPMNTFLGFFMDSMLGTTYEEGLANLKSVVES